MNIIETEKNSALISHG